MTTYIDSSAAAKLFVDEAESTAVAAYVDQISETSTRLAASCLLETELRRLAARLDESQAAVTEVLDRIELIEADRLLFLEAGLLPGKHLRSLHALHTVTALRIEADEFITYDSRQAETARSVGLRVASPT